LLNLAKAQHLPVQRECHGTYGGCGFYLQYQAHINQGTGSWPCPPQGLQLAIRFIVSQPPLKAPYFFIASTPYCEQVGV